MTTPGRRRAHRGARRPGADAACVMTVWEGIRRTYGAPPDQAAPLMPPELFDVLGACPTIKRWMTRNRADEADPAGARDRALLLIGFTAALRRSDHAALRVENRASQWGSSRWSGDGVAEHPRREPGVSPSLRLSKGSRQV